MGIAESANRVETLLVRRDPEYVRPTVRARGSHVTSIDFRRLLQVHTPDDVDLRANATEALHDFVAGTWRPEFDGF